MSLCLLYIQFLCELSCVKLLICVSILTVCKTVLQTLQPIASGWQLQIGFHRETACSALLISTHASATSLILSAFLQAVVSRPSVSWKWNQCFHKATCSNCLQRCCWQWEYMGGGPRSTWLENKGISFLVVAGCELKSKPYQYNRSSLCVSGMCDSSPSQPACSHYLPVSLWCSLDPLWAS